MTEALYAVVLAAGRGTRMRSALPKVMHRVAGRTLIGHVLAALEPLKCARVVVVVAPGMPEVVEAVAPHAAVVQDRQLGTAHAVLAARQALAGVSGDVIVLCGDAPLVRPQTLRRLVARRRAADAPALVVLAMEPADPGDYGRVVTGAGDSVEAIVEAREATPEQRRLGLCNSGVMAADKRLLFELLEGVANKNAKGEYYLPDVVTVARGRGLPCAWVRGDAAELIGVNSRAELAQAEAAMQERLRAEAMAGGASLRDPPSVHLCYDTRLAQDVAVGPNVVFGPGVSVGEGAEIRPFCHIEGAEIAAGAVVGPFARLRAGTVVGPRARIGNFVEAKNAVLGEGAKANHLSYLGDASVGAGANIGAGTITCNYDGIAKARTEIGAGAFIGSNTALVAPVSVGERAIVGAGSVITRDVAPDALAVARADQVERPDGATRFRDVRRAQEAKKSGRPGRKD